MAQAASRKRSPLHRQASEKTQTQARRLWELFRQAPGFICILRGPDHVVAFANDSYLRLVGGRELIGKPLLEALPEIADQGFPDILAEVYRSGETYTSFDTPVRLVRQPDGQSEQRFLNFVYQPIRDVHGRTTGVFVEGFDVTERVRAQAALREGEARLDRERRLYECVLANTPDLAYIFGLDHRFVYANEGLLEMWGKTKGEAIGKTFLELGYPDWHAAQHDREIDKVIATKQPVRGVVPFTGTFGRRLYDYIFTPVLNDEGEVEAVAGTTRDITELKQAKKATVRLASIVDSCDDAIISKDLQGVILSWNKSAERIFGYTAEEAVGRAITELIIPADRLEEEAYILRKLARGKAIDHYETIRRCKDGSTLEISVTISPLYENGRVVGGSKIARDISERKRAERHRELLIQELNHRVKNTLATVQSLAMQSLRDADSAEEGYAAFDARLLALSKAHDVLTSEHWAFAGLKKIVAGAIAPYSTPDSASRFYVKGASLRLEPRAGLALAMALHELATNAVKYGALSSEDGRVAIHWRHTREGKKGTARFHLLWTESGGPPVAHPKRHGFGSRLIKKGLAQDLGGAVDLRFERSGLVCEISAPLDGIVAKDGGGGANF